MAKDKDSGAIYVQIQPQRGICVDGRQTQEYVPRIDALLWKGYNIRIDLYEEIHGDYFNGEIDSMSFTVKHIVAPQELKEESSKIKSLVEGVSVRFLKKVFSQKIEVEGILLQMVTFCL